jgi:transposase-like protein
MTIQAKPIACPFCDSRSIVKKGARRNTYRQIQIYRCNSCFKYFSSTDLSRHKYPAHLLVKALCLYYRGYSQENVSRLLYARHHIRIPRRTISESGDYP